MTILLLLSLSALTLFAPAPFQRREKVEPFPAFHWTHEADQMQVWFHPDHTYDEIWRGVAYSGRWWREAGGVKAYCSLPGGRTVYKMTFERDGKRLRVLGYYVSLERQR